MPWAGSKCSLKIFSGVSWATFSISTPPFLGTHQDRFFFAAIQHDAEVKFAGNIATGFDDHLVDRFSFGTGLDRDQVIAQAFDRQLVWPRQPI